MTILNKSINPILILILVFSFVLRFWNLGSIPAGLTPDEAALGYNAYSILTTGKDEWGVRTPLIFKSFGDFKPGFYIYTSTPFIKLFGLSEFSTRASSAASGVITVYVLYLISLKLFANKKLSTFVSLVAALNPWLIFFSRGAWEANLSLMFTLLGIYLFLKIQENGKNIIFSAIFFGLTLLTYQGAKLSTLLVLLVLTLINRDTVLGVKRKYLVSAFAVGSFLALPILLSFFKGQTFRLNIYSIFSYTRPALEIQNIKTQENSFNAMNFFLYHSESLNYLRAILGRYFNNFSPRFLFFDGDWANPISTSPYQGVMLVGDLLFIPLGFLFLFQRRLKKEHLFILFWLIVAPLTSAISRDELNAVRDLNLAIPLIFISSFGIYYTSTLLLKRHMGFFVVGLTLLTGFVYFADSYFVHTNSHNSNHWRYGFRESMEFIEPIKDRYDKVVFEQSFNQPYIYKLFYGTKDPLGFQNSQKLVESEFKGDVGYVEYLDGIYFQHLDWQVLKKTSSTLVVAQHTSVPPDIFAYPDKYVLLNQIKYLNKRDIAFDIFEIK